MLDDRTYSITELAQISRFDRRTIVYYIQQGLLPKAGRRGPNTRHGHGCLRRLLFIRELKELQDHGRCGTITLKEMGRMLEALSPERLRDLLDRGLPMAEIEQLLKAPPAHAALPVAAEEPRDTAAAAPPAPVRTDGRSYGLADAGIRQKQSVPVAPRTPTPAQQPLPGEADEAPLQSPVPAAAMPDNLGDLLRELEVRPGLGGRRLPPGASEQWTEIPITSRVFLSVRGLSSEDAPLADATARALKRLLRTR